MSTSDWKIHRREERCARCERAFAEGEVVYSLLALDAGADAAVLQREDRCPACFQGSPESGADASGGVPATGELHFWRTRHAHDRRARFAVDFEAIEELFLALEGRREERLQELRYLLVLLLLRKRRLKLVGVRRHAGTAGGETLCVRRPRRAEEHEVPVFELDTERALALKAELARVFEGADVETLAHARAGDGGTRVGEADPASPAAPA
jgi:hypothetical protein